MFFKLEMNGIILMLLFGWQLGVGSSQCLTANDSPALMNQNAQKEMADARFGFALESLQQASLIESQDNIFYSPHSLHQALMLAYFGARGDTETALKRTLHIPQTISKIDAQRYYNFENVVKRNREENSTGNYEYKTANHIWVTNSKKIRQCILDLFSSDIEKTDFKTNPEAIREQINNWVSNTTKGNIRDLLPGGAITEATDLVLANAVYFKGLWQSRFDPANSKKDIFYATGSRNSFVTYMRQKRTFNHVVSEELGAHVLELPYKGDEISMYILLPPFATARSLDATAPKGQENVDQTEKPDRDGVRQLIERITTTERGAKELRELLEDGMPSREVAVSLPRFNIERELPIVPLLSAMGAGDLFTANGADLHGFVEDNQETLHLGEAVHRAKIDVNEEGTTAAAATALFSFRSSRPAEPAVFNANHPFIYFIYDRPTRSIVFSGIYRTPGNAQPASAV